MLYTWSYSSIYARECYALACRPFCFQHTLSTGSPLSGLAAFYASVLIHSCQTV